MMLQLNRVHALLHSQRIASTASIVMGCIDYLVSGTICTCAKFCPKIKISFFFARKAVDACRPGGVHSLSFEFWVLSFRGVFVELGGLSPPGPTPNKEVEFYFWLVGERWCQTKGLIHAIPDTSKHSILHHDILESVIHKKGSGREEQGRLEPPSCLSL